VPIPKISVILPAYNRPQELARSIRSVLSQPVRELELLVMDDHSGVETFKAVAQFNDPRLRYFRQPYNVGSSRNLSEGLKRASAPLCCFLMDRDGQKESFIAARIPDGTLLEGEGFITAMLQEPRSIGAFSFRRERLLAYWERAQQYGVAGDRAVLLDIALTPSACGVVLDRTDFWMTAHPQQTSRSHDDFVYQLSVRLLKDRIKTQGPRIRKHLEAHLAEAYTTWARETASRERFRSLQRLLLSVYYEPARWTRHRTVILGKILGLVS
jgi:glycosyltransferase involved in cell wall biosynthesis